MEIDLKTETRTCEQCSEIYEHEALIFNGIDIRDDVSICDSCDQKNREDEERAKREAKAKHLWEKIVPAEYRKTCLDHPDYPQGIHHACQKWIKGDGILEQEHLLFIGLIGESGLCKTRIVSQMVKRLIWEGESTVWVNSSQFQWACQNQFNDAEKHEASKWLKIYRTARWLVLDDIGSLKSTEVISDNLYSLLEYRTTRELPMIWTSNETLGEMLVGLSEKPRKRSLSRLAGFSNMINL